jgi:hypothetical protein
MTRFLALTGLVALVVLGLVAGLVTSDVAAGDKPAIEGPNGEHQVVVCKYVGTPGVDERLQTGNNPITPAASSLPGFTGTFPWVFADAQGRSIAIRWAASSHDGDISECPTPHGRIEVTPTAPTFQDPTCDVGAGVVLPTVTGVTYEVTGTVAPGRQVTVEATADEGYVLVGTDEWSHTFGSVPDNCTPLPPDAIEVTPGVTFQDPTCDVGAAVVPATSTGITYTVEGTVAPGEKVTVTASANDGYTIRGNNTWTHTFGLVPANCATAPPTDTTPTTTPTTTTPTTTTPTTPTTTTPVAPAAPLTPPTTKPAAATKPTAGTTPAAPKTAVAGASDQTKPQLAYTP